jgi:hypothetical protein
MIAKGRRLDDLFCFGDLMGLQHEARGYQRFDHINSAFPTSSYPPITILGKKAYSVGSPNGGYPTLAMLK